MTARYRDVLLSLGDHAKSLGIFCEVLTFEPKSAPSGTGLTYVLWASRIRPIASGMAVTGALVVISGRIYARMLNTPESEIDSHIADGLDALMGAYTGDFTLGGIARCFDLRGSVGVPADITFGYLEQDSVLFRVAVLTIPVIIDDAWTEAP
jgi:hypothetical protein